MKNKKNIILSISCFLLILLIVLLKMDKVYNFDNYVYNLISPFICYGLTCFFKFITNFASFSYIIIFIILSFILIKNKWIGIVIAINSVNSSIINKILKAIFVRPRPNVLRLIKQGGYSFPSGHAMASMTFYGFLIYLIIKSNINKNIKILLISLLTILILLIGISRIYLGVHYASDILAGYLVSIIYLILFTSVINKLDIGQ